MKLNKLASAISRGKWLIEPRTAMGERQRAVKFLAGDFDGNSAMEEPELEKPRAFKAGSFFDIDEANEDIFEVAESGSVAILPISGTIMKYDYCGTPGTDTLSTWLKCAIESPKIDAVVLLINSGGGSVEGTGEFADLIKKLSSVKPIVGLSEGMIASAAYWIGCSANELWVTHKTVEIGSIGVAVTFFDDSKYNEEAGFKDIYINADSSPDKNQDYFKAIKGDFSAIKASILNPTDDIFMASVKENRAGKLKLTDVTIDDKQYQEPLTGKVYLAETAIKNGLIDNIGTLDIVIERALELAIKNEPQNNINSEIMATKNAENKEEKKESNFDKLVNFIFGLKAEEVGATKADEDEEMSKKSDEDEEAKKPEEAKDAEVEGKKSDSDDDDDMDDPDKDDDDDSDEDDIEVNGKVFNMKKPEEAKAAILEIQSIAAEEKKATNEAIAELKADIAKKDGELSKKTEEVKKEIKSTFVPQSSKRVNRIGAEESDEDKASKQVLMPTEGSYADRVYRSTIAKAKAAKKQ